MDERNFQLAAIVIYPPRTEWTWRQVRRGEWITVPPDRGPQIIVRDCVFHDD